MTGATANIGYDLVSMGGSTSNIGLQIGAISNGGTTDTGISIGTIAGGGQERIS